MGDRKRSVERDRLSRQSLVLGLVVGLELPWELAYHALQQFRWEKDWPTLFRLITGLPEGLTVWVVLRLVIPASVARPTGLSFAIAFLTVWLVTWLWANGPMRAVFIHWRFHGGRVI